LACFVSLAQTKRKIHDLFEIGFDTIEAKKFGQTDQVWLQEIEFSMDFRSEFDFDQKMETLLLWDDYPSDFFPPGFR
jgi:hypothetical protein